MWQKLIDLANNIRPVNKKANMKKKVLLSLLSRKFNNNWNISYYKF